MKKAGKLAIRGLALTLLASSCATKRPFADNHIHEGIETGQITQNNIPYQKLDMGIFGKEYNFKSADDTLNSLGFEIRISKYTSDVFQYEKTVPTREAEDEFIPKKTNLDEIILTTYKEIPKNSKYDKSKDQIIYKKITTEQGHEFYIPTISLENKTFAVAENKNSKPGELGFYFIEMKENFKYAIDKPRIGNEQNIVGQGDIYKFILEQSNSNEVITKNIETQQYKIKYKDTYWSLAEKFYGSGKDASKLMKLNNTTNTKLMPGQLIDIPIRE